MNGMHIAFDISQTGHGKAGCGYYAWGMAQALIQQTSEARFTLLPDFGDCYFDPSLDNRHAFQARHVHYRRQRPSYAAAAAFWQSDQIERALNHPDIIHGNNFWCPRQPLKARLIYTLHDLSFMIEPRWTPEANRLVCCSGAFGAALHADMIVAVSDISMQQFLTIFPHFPAARMRVIHPATRHHGNMGPGVRPAGLNAVADRPFWLSVGTLEPRKNQMLLIEAYARYRASSTAPMPLVLAGGSGWLMDGLAQHIRERGLANDVLLTGYVSDDELIWLNRHCHANLYPSLFEGFGLPPIEAMQLGTACVISETVASTRYLQDAYLLSPHDADAWAMAMLDLQNCPEKRARLGEAGLRESRQFNWASSARQMMAAYAAALALPKRIAGSRD